MTEVEINQLAQDIHAGKVFTDRHVQVADDLLLVFMPFAFLQGDDLEKMNDVGMVYQYMNEAGPRSVNGMPTFMSFRTVSKSDLPLVLEKVRKIRAAVDSALAPEGGRDDKGHTQETDRTQDQPGNREASSARHCEPA